MWSDCHLLKQPSGGHGRLFHLHWPLRPRRLQCLDHLLTHNARVAPRSAHVLQNGAEQILRTLFAPAGTDFGVLFIVVPLLVGYRAPSLLHVLARFFAAAFRTLLCFGLCQKMAELGEGTRIFSNSGRMELGKAIRLAY